MDVTVTVEHRFETTPDGSIWTTTQFPYAFWRRYLDLFDRVRVIARAKPVAQPTAGSVRADGEGVAFHALPYYHGLAQYLKCARQVQQSVARAVQHDHALILRVHSPIAVWVERHLQRGRPFGVEVVADPWDVFSPGAFHHPLRPVLRRYYSGRLWRQCQRACAASFVTKTALQQRYPSAVGRFTTHYSSVDLPAAAFRAEPRKFASDRRRVRLITVGALSQMYKGVDLLIDACAQCLREGCDIELTIAGDGGLLEELKQRSAQTGFADRFAFVGSLPVGAAVRQALDRADLFVLASRQEGLPRAMIEAMARGLPCIGTEVGGIPELIPAEDRVPTNDVPRLAAKIREVVGNAERLGRMSRRNLATAQEYRDDLLRNRRREFYSAVRDATSRWKQLRHGSRSEENGLSDSRFASEGAQAVADHGEPLVSSYVRAGEPAENERVKSGA